MMISMNVFTDRLGMLLLTQTETIAVESIHTLIQTSWCISSADVDFIRDTGMLLLLNHRGMQFCEMPDNRHGR